MFNTKIMNLQLQITAETVKGMAKKPDARK